VTVFAALLGYVGLQLLIGAWVSRRIRTEDDYLLAGRRLGPVMATTSMFATWFGAETCVGAAGEVYQHGLSAVSSDPFGYGLCMLLFGLLLAAPLYRRGLTTLADLFRERFSPGVERTVALMLIPGSLLWAAAQIRAFGQVLASSGQFDEGSGIAIAASVTMAYTIFGGLLADAYTDLIQGAVLVGCLVVLFVVVVSDVGGVDATWSLLRTPSAAAEPTTRGALVTLNDWAIPVLGSLFAQELASRSLAARSARVAKGGALIAALLYLVIGTIPVVLGAIAHARLPGLDPEQVLSTLARLHLHELGFVMFAGALVSAILSTVDSALLVCGSLVSHNLAPVFIRDTNDAQKVKLARLSVFALGLCAFGLAHAADSVHGLVEQASAFGSAGICVSGLCALGLTRGGPASAYAALAAGALSWVVGSYVLDSDVAYLGSLTAAGLGYLVFALTREP
jgi:Na+/proline symporter